ncbi:MAG: hypothetical protein CVV41_15760 [Candidatus Riflebacteria bacterium HGW-Riflebacteria-1]|jgi:hypothetical protein|nr:MAG: hypothetical protein CVV41_15760 [Candidatus Riflebacteria bacterium HGW-Riflebacteria-1]
MGGGLGHITRFTAFCRTFAIRPFIITGCEQVRTGKLAVQAEETMLPDAADIASKASFAAWVAGVIKSCRPDKLIIDAFPGGILGELCGLAQLQEIECEYLARILDLAAYEKRLAGSLPQFQKIYRLERLGENQEKWLTVLNSPIEDLTLFYGLADVPTAKLPDNFWLIIHSGSDEELRQLWLFARQTAELAGVTPAFVIVSPGPAPDFLPPEAMHFDVYPADALIARACRVFSAAGFNIMQQMRLSSAKHDVMPMPRALDDQFLRHQFWREKGLNQGGGQR